MPTKTQSTQPGPNSNKTIQAIRAAIASLSSDGYRAEELLDQLDKNAGVATAQDEALILIGLEKVLETLRKKVLGPLGELAEKAAQKELF